MLFKLVRGALSLFVVGGMLSLGYFSSNIQTQVSTNKLELGVNALALTTGSIYTQPVDSSGKLYLSAWIDPDGSDFDQYIWDNFTLQSNETITDIEWTGGYDPLKFGMGGPVVDFTVAIYPSIAAGTEPDVAHPQLAKTYQTGGNANETAIGLVNGIPMYTYAFSLPAPFAASAGVKYWVHIKAFQHGSSPDWGVAAATDGDGNHYRWGAGAGGDSGYRSVPGDAAFTLLGPIPAAPTDISLSNNVVDENLSADTVVGALAATDPDPNAMFTFSLTCAVAGADDGSFNISGSNLQTSLSFDYETQNVFDICIRVTNQGGMTFDKNFVIAVNDVNEAPTGLSLSNFAVDENQPIDTLVGELSATDPDTGARFAFSLTCSITGADDTSFNINGINLQTSAPFDFETQNMFDICIRVTDQGGLTLDNNFVFTVNDLNEAPTGVALSNATVNEKQPINTVVGALTAIDPDAGATFTFSLTCKVAGADDASFNILGSNLQTSEIFVFGMKSTYNICVNVTDQGGLDFDKNFVITVNNVNEAPTGISLSAISVDENQPINTVVGALTATDPDAGATFTFSLMCAVPGTNDLSFNISGTNLQTSAAFDYETKSTYNICIRVADQGGLAFDKNFVVNVNNINEVPIGISLTTNSVDENQPVNTVVSALSATDPDASAFFTFGLACAVPGADDGSFNILGTNLRTSAMFDYETKSMYNICVRVTDQGGLTFDKTFTVTINNLSENTAPTDISLSNTTVTENQLVNTLVGALSAIDPDAGATFTFSLACTVAGADDGSFNVLETNLRTSVTFDFEMRSSYDICIRVTDQGGLFLDRNFAISVNNINEAPTDISLSNNVIDENQPVNTMIGLLSATDPDAGAMFTFGLTCVAPGLDDGSFNLSGANLQTSAVFDYETKSTYTICVRVTDQGGLFLDKNFTISVNNVNEISNTPGKVTGGGNIDLSSGKANSGFVVQYDAGDANPSGNLTFMDHSEKLSLKASSFTLLYIDDNHARITGFATVNGVSNISFTLDVYDYGEPGTADIFMIQIPALNGYSAGGIITGGNIQITAP